VVLAEGLVLLIVDDITDWESCRELLPTAKRFRVLITTRRRNIDPSYIQEISLEVLSPEAALQFLTKLVGDRVRKSGQKAVELCQQLGYLPLGVQLVGRYLAEVAQNWTDAVDDENLCSVFVGLGKFYQGQGLYAIAEPYTRFRKNKVEVMLICAIASRSAFLTQ
jgi:hypothetical protein